MHSLHVFLHIAKYADFRQKITNISRTQGMCNVIHIFFGSFLG